MTAAGTGATASNAVWENERNRSAFEWQTRTVLGATGGASLVTTAVPALGGSVAAAELLSVVALLGGTAAAASFGVFDSLANSLHGMGVYACLEDNSLWAGRQCRDDWGPKTQNCLTGATCSIPKCLTKQWQEGSFKWTRDGCAQQWRDGSFFHTRNWSAEWLPKTGRCLADVTCSIPKSLTKDWNNGCMKGTREHCWRENRQGGSYWQSRLDATNCPSRTFNAITVNCLGRQRGFFNNLRQRPLI